jgi:hypothetical protein
LEEDEVVAGCSVVSVAACVGGPVVRHFRLEWILTGQVLTRCWD